ncbi:MAG TPA: hypothetical protein VIK04_03145 [Solirubrobacteraceae bacterium]
MTATTTARASRPPEVPPGAGGLTVVTGLAFGSYRVLVDGTAQATVVVGAQGGP